MSLRLSTDNLEAFSHDVVLARDRSFAVPISPECLRINEGQNTKCHQVSRNETKEAYRKSNAVSFIPLYYDQMW